MSYKSVAEASVKSPKDKHPRRGRGFSRKELVEANLNIDEARQLGLIIDIRRKTFYEDNVESLKTYVEDMKKLIPETKPSPKVPKESPISELSTLKSVTESDATLLTAAGISTVEDLAYCEIDKVTKKTGLDDDKITKMIKEALKKV